MPNELTVNLQIDASPECLKRLCDGLAAAVKPDGGYRAATLEDPDIGDGGDQMVQVEWWIPQHGCDSLENTLDAIKGRLLVAVRDWWATALAPATTPAPEPGRVAIPCHADMAVAMVLLGEGYLREHAPDRLRPAAPAAPKPGEVGELVAWLQSMRELAGEHNPEEQRRYDRAAALLQQAAPAPAVVPVAGEQLVSQPYKSPEPGEGPTDNQLLAMRSWSSHGPTFDSDLVDFARNILSSRWCRPAAPPTPEPGEVDSESIEAIGERVRRKYDRSGLSVPQNFTMTEGPRAAPPAPEPGES